MIYLVVATAPLAGAVNNAASIHASDVQAAINASVTGDTVLVPTGTGNWTNEINIPNGKHITLRGGGMGITVVTSILETTIQMNQTTSRLTGFTLLHSLTNDGTYYMVRASGSGAGFRVDHCAIESTTGTTKYGVYAAGSSGIPHPIGLIDHCSFVDMRNLINGDFSVDVNTSGEIWAAPLDLGGREALFIEDNTFRMSALYINCIDNNYSGKYVFRHNVTIDTAIEAHSIAGTYRGSRSWEIYFNTIIQSNLSCYVPMFLRAGTGVVYSNVVIGSYSFNRFHLDNRRSNASDVGGAFGGDPQDGNTALANGTGTHDGAADAAALTDSTKTWTVNAYNTFYVYNLTDGSKGLITANTATTVTATLTGGTDNNWDAGDSYKITDGYPARDQIGRSTDDFEWTAGTPYPPQSLDAAYFWGNTRLGAALDAVVVNGVDRHIQSGRDFYSNVGAKPGYASYTYPHPMNVSDSISVTPAAATIGGNVKVGGNATIR